MKGSFAIEKGGRDVTNSRGGGKISSAAGRSNPQFGNDGV
jgi:hypothetical protein